MKIKRLLSALLTATILAGTVLIGVTAAGSDTLPFDDVPNKWFKNAVSTVYEEGIMTGKSDTKFDPTAMITRAEVVTAFARVACTNIGGKGETLTFSDTKTGKWYSDSVGWAAECGIVKGRGDGRFSPNDKITRAELASIIVNFVSYMELTLPDAPKIDKFADTDTFAKWMREPVEAVRKMGLMQGDNGKFKPKGNATRAEIAQVIANLLPNVGRIDVVVDGKTDYTVVYDDTTAAAAERLQYQIRSLTGAEIAITTDTAVGGKVIKLGELSGINAEGLGETGYNISIDDENILVNGEADGIYKAVVRLVNNCAKNNDLRITEKTSEVYEHEYPIGKLTISGNDISKYVIKYTDGASASVVTAASELQKYIKKACGVELSITTGGAGAYAIILDDKAFNDDETFSVKTVGNNLVIGGSGVRGVLYGVYDFLDQCIGWKYITKDIDYIESKDELNVENVSYTEKQYFEWRHPYYRSIRDNEEFAAKLKVNASPVITEKFGGYNTGRGQGCHTFERLTNGLYDQSSQPCLSDPEIFDMMLENVFKIIEQNPNIDGVNVSQNDTPEYCKCEKCAAVDAEEGSNAGTVIRFVNAIAEEVEKKYPDVYIQTLAYYYSRKPPKTPPRDNVVVQLCNIECCFGHALNDPKCAANASFAEDIKGWSEICDKLYVWDYTTNFNRYLTPFVNFDYEVLGGNIKFFHENNVIGLFEQNNGNSLSGKFDDMKVYLISKMMSDPAMTEEEYYAHMDTYLKGAYGDKWSDVRAIIDKMINVSSNMCFTIYAKTNSMEMYLRRDLENYVNLFEQMELASEDAGRRNLIDRSQTQFEYLWLGAFFNQEFKSGDEARAKVVIDKSFALQNKLKNLKMYFSEGRSYPNFTEFTFSPIEWGANWQ